MVFVRFYLEFVLNLSVHCISFYKSITFTYHCNYILTNFAACITITNSWRTFQLHNNDKNSPQKPVSGRCQNSNHKNFQFFTKEHKNMSKVKLSNESYL